MRTSTEWLRYFESNARQLLDIPWDHGPELTDAEVTAVGPSIAEFQRGESGEGRHLIQYARAYGEHTGDGDYVPAVVLFIREEQRHARDLRRVLELHHIALARASFADAVFRRLRNVFGSLEVSIAVLITAELMAQVYYEALRQATGSTILRRLCEQILNDEARHVEFQAERLGMVRARHGAMRYLVTMSLQRSLFAGTSVVVWLVHRHALRRGGYPFSRFWTEAWRCFAEAFAISAAVKQIARDPDYHSERCASSSADPSSLRSSGREPLRSH